MNPANIHRDNMDKIREKLENSIKNSSVDVWFDNGNCFFDITQTNQETGNKSTWAFCVDFGTGKVIMLEPSEKEDWFENDNEVFEIIKSFLHGGNRHSKKIRSCIDYDAKPIKSSTVYSDSFDEMVQKDFTYKGNKYTWNDLDCVYYNDNGDEDDFFMEIPEGAITSSKVIKSDWERTDMASGSIWDNGNYRIIERRNYDYSNYHWGKKYYMLRDKSNHSGKDKRFDTLAEAMDYADFRINLSESSRKPIKSSKSFTKNGNWKYNTAVLPSSKSILKSFFEDGSWSWDDTVALVGHINGGRPYVIFGAAGKYPSLEKGRGLYHDQTLNDIGWFTFERYCNDDSVFNIPQARYAVLK